MGILDGIEDTLKVHMYGRNVQGLRVRSGSGSFARGARAEAMAAAIPAQGKSVSGGDGLPGPNGMH